MDLISDEELSEINKILVGIREWFKRTQLKFGWARCYAKEKSESPWATAESLLGLCSLGEPLHSLAMRKGFLYYFHNFPTKESWKELVWNPRAIDALPWSIAALSLGKSKMCKRLCSGALSALCERGEKSGRYWPDDSYMVLYTCSMTLKALHLMNGRKDLQTFIVTQLKRWKTPKGGFGTNVRDTIPDACYTAHILEAFLDIGVISPEEIQILTRIIKEKRNEDHGWGSRAMDYPDPTIGVSPDESYTEATAQCVVALLKAGEPLTSEYIVDGIKWLLNPKLRDNNYGFRLTEKTEVRNFATYYAGYAFLHYLILKEFYEKHGIPIDGKGLTGDTRRIFHRLAFENYFNQLKLRNISLKTLFLDTFSNRLFSSRKKTSERRLQILSILDERPMSTLELTKRLGLNPRTDETKVKEDINFFVESHIVFEESPGSYWTILDAEL